MHTPDILFQRMSLVCNIIKFIQNSSVLLNYSQQFFVYIMDENLRQWNY